MRVQCVFMHNPISPHAVLSCSSLKDVLFPAPDDPARTRSDRTGGAVVPVPLTGGSVDNASSVGDGIHSFSVCKIV